MTKSELVATVSDSVYHELGMYANLSDQILESESKSSVCIT